MSHSHYIKAYMRETKSFTGSKLNKIFKKKMLLFTEMIVSPIIPLSTAVLRSIVLRSDAPAVPAIVKNPIPMIILLITLITLYIVSPPVIDRVHKFIHRLGVLDPDDMPGDILEPRPVL